jgi:outer membrane protein OmpA-like peptidoglycan-associated protein
MEGDQDGLDDESAYDVWPALTDLLAASAMLFLVLLAVVIFDREIERGRMRTLRDELVAALNSIPNRERLFSIDDDPQLVRITLQEDVTFPSNRYTFNDLKPEGRRALGEIGRILTKPGIKTMYQQVIVLGHTDQVPIWDPQFSNWELSAMRAAAVVRLLVHYAKVDPCLITASGAGPYFPKSRPDGVASRKENRRIEIVILPARVQQVSRSETCYPSGDGSLAASPAATTMDTAAVATPDTAVVTAPDTAASPAPDTARVSEP